MAKLKLRVDEDEYLYPKTYTPTQYTMLGAYKAFVEYSCKKKFNVRGGMMDDIERISKVMTSDDFSRYLINKRGKYATLTQIAKEITQTKK